MKNILKKYSFVLLLLLACSAMRSQTTYTVTSNSLGSSGDLDDVISSAVTDANGGDDVTIYLNVTAGSGLVEIDAPLPPINISDGSITIDKYVSATVPQGIVYTGAVDDDAIGYGFGIFGTASGTFVTIKNLTIKDFIHNTHGYSRSGVTAVNTYSVTIENNVFDGNEGGVVDYYGRDLLIQNNTFINGGLLRDIDNYIYPGAGPYTVTIQNNDETGLYTGMAIWYDYGTDEGNVSYTITGNTLNGYAAGLIIKGYDQSVITTPDITFEVNVDDNTFNCSSNVFYIDYPFEHFSITNNDCNITNTGSVQHVALWGRSSQDPDNPFGLDFINTNDLGYTPANSGNTFTCGPSNASAHTSFNYIGYSFTDFKLVGQDLSGAVTVTNGEHVIIRQTKIKSNTTTDRPIILSSGNEDIEKPVLLSAGYYPGNVTFTYELDASLSNDNGSFAVDFYKSNSNGDLLDYIGTQVITSLTGSIYSVTLTMPGGMTLGLNERLAATVTSLGDLSETTSIGTSEVAYINLDFVLPCENCVGSFSPEPGDTFLVSTWVKEENAPLTKSTYDKAELYLDFPGTATTLGPFVPGGLIIDGWQRIEEVCIVPIDATSIEIKLQSNDGDVDVFFDDLRFFPKNGSMKTYVYDPVSLRLVAELDERNYATIYEYDEEGKLLRVKKETERGIMTIQENKNNTSK